MSWIKEFIVFFSVFVLTTEIVSRSGVIQKANVMYLSKEAMNKNHTLKMELSLSSDDKAIARY